LEWFIERVYTKSANFGPLDSLYGLTYIVPVEELNDRLSEAFPEMMEYAQSYAEVSSKVFDLSYYEDNFYGGKVPEDKKSGIQEDIQELLDSVSKGIASGKDITELYPSVAQKIAELAADYELYIDQLYENRRAAKKTEEKTK